MLTALGPQAKVAPASRATFRSCVAASRSASTPKSSRKTSLVSDGPRPRGREDAVVPKTRGTSANVIQGKPDEAHVSTSYVERQNLTMRMSMRQFTRLTNAFSKKVQNLEAALAIHYMHYNFCRVHKTLGTTPAVAAGVADHVWHLREVVDLLVKREKSAASK